MPDSSAIVSKVWNYVHVLKNAGVGYRDYVEQISYPILSKFTGVTAEGPSCDLLSAALNQRDGRVNLG
jgi:hypothetical protein